MEGRLLGSRSIKHYRTSPSRFFSSFPLVPPMYHGLTYKRACVSPEIDSWHARSVHTYTLRSIGLLLDIGTYTPFVPFPPSKKEQKDPSGAHYRQGPHRTKSARTIVWHPHLVTKPLSATPSLLWITLAFCS